MGSRRAAGRLRGGGRGEPSQGSGSPPMENLVGAGGVFTTHFDLDDKDSR